MQEPLDLDPKYTVHSLVRAFTLLNAISEYSNRDGMTLTELAKAVGMSKGSVFSTLQTLRAYGIVADHGAGHGRRYRLGLGLIRLGNRAAAHTNLADVARPHLEALSSETGLTSRVAMIKDNWAVAVAQVNPPGAVQVNLGLGEREWPHRSAVGKALLLDSDAEQIATTLAHTGMPSKTRHTMTTLDDFMANIKQSRERGFALDDEEDRDGIMCVAVPVRITSGDTIAAMSVTGLKASPELSDPAAVATVIKKHARALARELSVGQ